MINNKENLPNIFPENFIEESNINIITKLNEN